MKKREYFIAALKARCFTKLHWLTSISSIPVEGVDGWRKNPYPYRIVKQGKTFLYVSPDDKEKLIAIEGVDTETLINIRDINDRIVVSKKDAISVGQGSINTSYGNLLLNYLLLIDIVGDKHPYVNTRVKIPEIERWFVKHMKDGLYFGETKEAGDQNVYVTDLKRFGDACSMLDNLAVIAVPSITEKLLRRPTGVDEFRESLFKKYEGQLNDPTIVAIIDEALAKFIDDFIGDDPGRGLLTKNSINMVRKKYFGMVGQEKTLGDTVKPTTVTKPLIDGLDVDKFAVSATSVRSGSIDRGSETEKGGVIFKEIQNATMNMHVSDEEDCGTKLTFDTLVTKDWVEYLVGRWRVVNGKAVLIDTEEQAMDLLGKVIALRSPLYCKSSGNSYCKKCLKSHLVESPNRLSIAETTIGAAYVGESLKGSHAKQTTTIELDIDNLIS